MKKTLTVILAAVLCVLMALPFAMMTSADTTVDVPARPTANGTDKVYVSYNTANSSNGTGATNTGGNSPATAFKISQAGGWSILMGTNTAKKATTVSGNDTFAEGGSIIVVGKGAILADFEFPETTKTLVITAKDGDTSYISRLGDSSLDYMTETGAHSLQCGMFMTDPDNTLTFKCDVIFKDIAIINRQSDSVESSSKTPTVYKITNGKSLLIQLPDI